MKKYLSLVKFSHTIFAMPLAFIVFFLAVQTSEASFDWVKFLLMIACMVFATIASMAFYPHLDRAIAARNHITSTRGLPRGALSARSALLYTMLNCLAIMV